MPDLRDAERARLVAAYGGTDYRVGLTDGPATLRVGMPWAAIDPRLTKGAACLAYLTAVNPASKQLSADENIQRQQELLGDIMTSGYRAVPGLAVADDGSWPDEPGFLVPGLPLAPARALAERYGQNAFLHAQAGEQVRLIWCAT